MIRKLFSELNEKKVNYIHFKSNLNLDRSFKGETDFDILVHPKSLKEFQNIMINFGAKLRYGTFNTVYPGVEHWLKYDSESENLFHLHVHYELIFGLGHRKNYKFPELNTIFQNKELHQSENIYIVSDRFELFLLVIRILLKFDPSRRTMIQVIRGYRIPSGMRIELDDLLNRIDFDSFEKWCYNTYPKQAQTVLKFLELYQTNSTIRFFVALKAIKELKQVLIPFQRTDYKTAKTFELLRRKSSKNEVRWLPPGGKIISIVGADGAGKTTLSNDIVSWLNRKLTAKYVYLGKPKGNHLNKYQKKIQTLYNLIFYPNRLKRTEKKHIQVALSRYKSWKNAKYLSGNGWLVVTDRYPLREFRDMPHPMDGPRIEKTRKMSKKELEIYDNIAPYPGLTIVLDVDYKTATKRKELYKSTEQKDQYKDKIQAIKKLKSSRENNIVVVDANMSYEKVRKNVKEIIWNHL